ncbi:hypothetical protein Gorai_002922, partial [Gossypium raimondii]|nr:hypothetical protein [Gossypium raimondii]
NADECTGNGGSKFGYPIVVDKSGGGNFTRFNLPLILFLKKIINGSKFKLIPMSTFAAKILGDKSAFFKCGFLGLQDTLWDASGRHYFAKCHIEAAADFIFGSGQSIYHACKINVTAGALSSQYPYGYITAQGQGSSDDTSGFVFKGGTLFGNVRPYLG